jgi:hypothetical protein|tara:strand:- start:299 stop:415 length:117 start_codon:yes stop_codon:yes gene_type:complete
LQCAFFHEEFSIVVYRRWIAVPLPSPVISLRNPVKYPG